MFLRFASKTFQCGFCASSTHGIVAGPGLSLSRPIMINDVFPCFSSCINYPTVVSFFTVQQRACDDRDFGVGPLCTPFCVSNRDWQSAQNLDAHGTSSQHFRWTCRHSPKIQDSNVGHWHLLASSDIFWQSDYVLLRFSIHFSF